MRAPRRQHVPDAVAHHHGIEHADAEALGGGDEQIGVGLGVFNLIARHHRHAAEIDAEMLQHRPRRFHAPAGGDRPGDGMRGEMGEQRLRARQRTNARRAPAIGFGMPPAQPFPALRGDVEPGFAQQNVGEQTPAHADLAVDAPDRQRDPLLLQRLLPGQHMIIHTVHQRAVEIEQKTCLRDRHGYLL